MSYLAGLAFVVAAMWRGSVLLHGDQRRPWVLLAGAATCWLVGDVLQRVPGSGPDSAPGVKDVFWLASYPHRCSTRLDSVLMVVNGMLGAAALHPRRTELTDRAVRDREAAERALHHSSSPPAGAPDSPGPSASRSTSARRR